MAERFKWKSDSANRSSAAQNHIDPVGYAGPGHRSRDEEPCQKADARRRDCAASPSSSTVAPAMGLVKEASLKQEGQRWEQELTKGEVG